MSLGSHGAGADSECVVCMCLLGASGRVARVTLMLSHRANVASITSRRAGLVELGDLIKPPITVRMLRRAENKLAWRVGGAIGGSIKSSMPTVISPTRRLVIEATYWF
jgi:hypothetical protein